MALACGLPKHLGTSANVTAAIGFSYRQRQKGRETTENGKDEKNEQGEQGEQEEQDRPEERGTRNGGMA